MEYIRHGDLSGHIMDMDEYDAKVIGHQLLKGLKILREENIAHFDLKPGNILVVRTKPRWVRRLSQDRKVQKLMYTSGLRSPILVSAKMSHLVVIVMASYLAILQAMKLLSFEVEKDRQIRIKLTCGV